MKIEKNKSSFGGKFILFSFRDLFWDLSVVLSRELRQQIGPEIGRGMKIEKFAPQNWKSGEILFLGLFFFVFIPGPLSRPTTFLTPNLNERQIACTHLIGAQPISRVISREKLYTPPPHPHSWP